MKLTIYFLPVLFLLGEEWRDTVILALDFHVIENYLSNDQIPEHKTAQKDVHHGIQSPSIFIVIWYWCHTNFSGVRTHSHKVHPAFSG